MKKFIYFLLLPLLCSCTDSLLEEDEASTDKLVAVSFNLGGDYDIEFEDLSRASVASGDLVGIQVYEGNDPYAYGLFNGIPQSTLLLKAGKTYKFECRIVKDGVAKIYHKNSEYGNPFRKNGRNGNYTCPISQKFTYNNSYCLNLFQEKYELGTSTATVYRPSDIVTYAGTLTDYHPMENGVVKLSLKCNKAPWVTLNFTSDVPDGEVVASMEYYGYKKQIWYMTNSDEIRFQRDTSPMAQIMDGTWWGGVEKVSFLMTWKRGPEANSFITTHKNVSLGKDLYLDNDKNYTLNLHVRGQSDSDPEVWVDVDTDPDHTGDLDEDDDSNE